MNFTPEMLASMAKVEAAREANIALEPRRMDADEKDALLRAYHPDYREERLWRNSRSAPTRVRRLRSSFRRCWKPRAGCPS